LLSQVPKANGTLNTIRHYV